jgi:hypothetical protein
MVTYTYGPMYDKANRFRLFKIETISSYKGIWQNLRCELVEHSIDAAPAYYALSYEWGEESHVSIYVDGLLLSIPRPLHRFMGQLASCSGYYSSDYFYADAICIDQGNGDEKKTQIPAMGRIFRNAKRVLCWLGDLTKSDSDILPRLIDPEICYSRESAARDMRDHFRALADAYTRETPTASPSAIRIWAIALMTEFVRKSYWSRLWIVQEILLAQNITLFCGHYKFNWAQLEHWLPQHEPGGSLD